MPFDGVAQARRSIYEKEHLGRIAIPVGAEGESLGRTAAGPDAIRAEVGA
jgi:crotonyl-CoA carboxylase/reductase